MFGSQTLPSRGLQDTTDNQDAQQNTTDSNNQDWNNFMEGVTNELTTMSLQLETVCSQSTRASRRSRSPRTPRSFSTRAHPYEPPTQRTVNTKLLEELEKRRAEAANLQIRRKPEKDPDRELFTNYKYFPPRQNASRRIFKPDKLNKYELYKNPKRIVPVLTGSTMRLSTGSIGYE